MGISVDVLCDITSYYFTDIPLWLGQSTINEHLRNNNLVAEDGDREIDRKKKLLLFSIPLCADEEASKHKKLLLNRQALSTPLVWHES